ANSDNATNPNAEPGTWQGVGAWQNLNTKTQTPEQGEGAEQGGNTGDEFDRPAPLPPFTPDQIKQMEENEFQYIVATKNLAEATAKYRGVFGRKKNQEAFDNATQEYSEIRNQHINDKIESYKREILAKNPEMTQEELELAANIQVDILFTKAENLKNLEICEHIDGRADGLGRASKFVRKWGAFWDKHPKMKIAVGVSAAVGVGVATGGLGLAGVPAVLSAMGVAGAQSAIWSRSGSKNSRFKIEHDTLASIFESYDTADEADDRYRSFSQRAAELIGSGEFTNNHSAFIQAIGEIIDEKTTVSADLEHNANFKKTRNGIITSAAIAGAVSGAMQFLQTDVGQQLVEKARDWFMPGSGIDAGVNAGAMAPADTTVDLINHVPPVSEIPNLDALANLNLHTPVTPGIGTIEFLGNAGFDSAQINTILSNSAFAQKALETGFGYSMDTLGGVGINLGTPAGAEMIKFASTLI
ncbi:hypothetical protein FWF93_03270, partial [Candidatus Saccharibacteria bacterium]|nr:hypothetical protein [Candidatus Saccharibacteria bacterium]